MSSLKIQYINKLELSIFFGRLIYDNKPIYYHIVKWLNDNKIYDTTIDTMLNCININITSKIGKSLHVLNLLSNTSVKISDISSAIINVHISDEDKTKFKNLITIKKKFEKNNDILYKDQIDIYMICKFINSCVREKDKKIL